MQASEKSSVVPLPGDRPQVPSYSADDPGLTTLGPPRPRYGPRRVFCGLWWGLITIGGAGACITGLANSQFLHGLGELVVAILAGWYDYRIWSLKAKWLMFLFVI